MARPRVSTDWTPQTIGRSAAPLREQALEVLRKAILSRDLAPGERLVERELIERLGVSRTTIREALRELESERLIEVIPQRGAVVSALSSEDAADLYEARVAIEALLVRRFVERASDATLTELLEAIDDFANVCNVGGDIRSMLAAKDRFYRVLGAGADSEPLRHILRGLQGRVQFLRATSLSAPGRAQQSAQEIRALGEAIARRDPDGAAALCSSHVQTAARTGLAALATPDPRPKEPR